jgi:hypothetical protein
MGGMGIVICCSGTACIGIGVVMYDIVMVSKCSIARCGRARVEKEVGVATAHARKWQQRPGGQAVCRLSGVVSHGRLGLEAEVEVRSESR